MSKQFGGFWPQVTSFLNLHIAFRKASRGKRSKTSVAAFEFALEDNLFVLQEELQNGSYEPGGYVSFTIHDPKRRLISAAPFRDRVVHHALCNVIEPIWERKFIYDTYANRTGKGTHKALDRCTQYLRCYQYVLPLDIVQYFPSIDHEILLKTLAATIADEQVLGLCADILSNGEGVQHDAAVPALFPEDDLLSLLRPHGLPIGNLTSQFWGNVYLSKLDHFIKRELKCKGYVRYVDDMLLFSDSKSQLHEWREAVIAQLAALRLVVHENSAQVRPCRAGLPFLGFQVFSDHRRLKRQKAVHARRSLHAKWQSYQRGELDADRLNASIQGWIGHACHGDTWGLRRDVLREIVL
ncbi:MAG: RNA-directed DNA polymerase [Anaerolineaceae bacterium]|nr:RNA-directed DNA polymerase [Anaerolineaceae bacterium]